MLTFSSLLCTVFSEVSRWQANKTLLYCNLLGSADLLYPCYQVEHGECTVFSMFWKRGSPRDAFGAARGKGEKLCEFHGATLVSSFSQRLSYGAKSESEKGEEKLLKTEILLLTMEAT